MNLEIAKQALQVIRDYPDWHDQGEWVQLPDDDDASRVFELDEDRKPPCGTTLCFAGFVALLNAPVGSVVHSGGWMDFPDGNEVWVDKYATETLGLDDEIAGAFYYDAKTLEDLEALVSHLTEHPDASREDLSAGVLGVAAEDEEMED